MEVDSVVMRPQRVSLEDMAEVVIRLGWAYMDTTVFQVTVREVTDNTLAFLWVRMGWEDMDSPRPEDCTDPGEALSDWEASTGRVWEA
jgi:hypothetical protein